MVQSLDDARRRTRSGTTGRVPPHNLQAEESLLGAMLLSRDAIAAAVETCGADDFYKPAHGHVFDAVCSLYGQGEPADPVTVADELRRADLLEAIGGPGTLISLQANTPATANAGRYARIVEEHALLRRLIGVAGEIAEIGYGVPDDVAQAIDRAESMVFEIAERRVTDTLRPLHDLLSESLDRLEALYDRGESITGVPTGYLDLDERLSGLQQSNLVIVGARPSMGKAQPVDTPVLTLTGWRPIGSLCVGDHVVGANGRPTAVTGVFPQGLLAVHRVVLSDGTSTRACAEHLWLVRTDDEQRNGRRGTVRTTVDIAAELTTGELGSHGLPVVAPVQHPEAGLPLDPYLLGLLVGGGASAGGVPTFTTEDAELIAALEDRLPFGVVAKKVPSDPNSCALFRDAGRGQTNPIAEILEALGLWGHSSDDAFIPPRYLYASQSQRFALLQGLMDTGGRHDRSGLQYDTPSAALARDFAELARSLGAVARLRLTEITRFPSHNVMFTLPTTVVPYRLQRKIDRFASDLAAGRTGRQPDHHIVSVTPDGAADCVCIAVEAADNLYVTEDHIVTHNTALALGMAAHASMVSRVPVLFFSLEMSHSEVTQRLLCSEARVDSSRIRNGKLMESDWPKISHAIGRLGEAPLYIDDNPNLTIMEIRAKARRLRSRLGSLGLIIVDYLQLMSGRHSAENRQVEVSEISRGLKILARELEVPVVALSQLSRNLEARSDKRPMLADLRESGCMPAMTRLQRADTGAEITLGELVASGATGIPVWSLDDSSRLVPACLTHAFPSGIKPVFRLQTASGRSVEATANHRFRTLSGWTPLADLSVGDRLAVPSRLAAPQTLQPMDQDELILLAHLLGDGCVPPKRPTHYTSADFQNLDIVEAAAARRFGIISRRVQKRRWGHSYLPAPHHAGRRRSDPLHEWWNSLGLRDHRSHENFIPDCVQRVPDAQVALFLRHLWATNGSVNVKRSRPGQPPVAPYYASTSRRLVDDVRRLLLRLDIQTKLVTVAHERHRYRLAPDGSTNLIRFLTVIGGHDHRRTPKSEATGGDIDGRSGTEHVALLNKVHCGAHMRGAESGPHPMRGEWLEMVDRVVDDKSLAGLATSDVTWDRVVAIEPLGDKPVFDATVLGTHNFIADGIIAHNSLEQDADVVMFLYRDEVYNPDSADRGMADVIVSKHRNGPTGITQLSFLHHYTRFENMARV